MDTKLRQLNRLLKAHDKELYARRERNDLINVYRKGIAWGSYDLDCGNFFYSYPSPHFVFSLSSTWNARGYPVDYGLEVVLARLKAHDLWNREGMIEEMIKGYEKDKESKTKDRQNNVESFLYDFHSTFKKTFSDVNTSLMKKE